MSKRLNVLIAVIEKYLDMDLSACDIFVNLAGGLNITEPAIDLGIAIAVVSSYLDRPVPGDTVILGELGLSSEVRPVTKINDRIKEALRLGFSRVVSPSFKKGEIASVKGGNVRIDMVSSLPEAKNALL